MVSTALVRGVGVRGMVVSGWGSCLPVGKASVLKATGGGVGESYDFGEGTWDAWQELLATPGDLKAAPGQLLTQSSPYRNARDQLSRESAHAASSDRSPGAQGMDAPGNAAAALLGRYSRAC